MGIIESTLGRIVHALLMPKEVPAWYAGGGKLSLPEAPKECLQLLGHVRLQVSDLQAARAFYVDTLGFDGLGDADQAAAVLRVGAASSELRLEAAQGAEAWPGHIYLWVRDMKATLERCRVLEARLGVALVEEVHNVTAETVVDALQLRDPDGNRFLVNQAPRNFADKVGNMLKPDAPAPGNVLAVVEACHVVPPGVAKQAAQFYRHFLGAAVTPKDGGWAVHFAPGKALRQALVFLDDDEQEISMEVTHSVCVYLPTEERFKAAFDKCCTEGVLSGSAASWPVVAEAREFRIASCVDPDDLGSALELETVVRPPSHPESALRAKD